MFVEPGCAVENHAALRREASLSHVAVNENVDAGMFRDSEREMGHDIVSFRVGVVGIVFAYAESAMLGAVESVGELIARLVGVECRMIIWICISEAFHPHPGIGCRDNLHSAVFVAGRKYQGWIVFVIDRFSGYPGGVADCHGVVDAAVLAYG